jgi:hypothetical protein
MPSRNNTQTVKGGPQGSDAFITVRKLRYGERDLQDTLSDISVRVGELQGEFDNADSQRQRDILSEVSQIEGQMLGLLLPFVTAWNWVNDAGEKMPLPSDIGSVELNMDEVTWLRDSIQSVLFPSQKK